MRKVEKEYVRCPACRRVIAFNAVLVHYKNCTARSKLRRCRRCKIRKLIERFEKIYTSDHGMRLWICKDCRAKDKREAVTRMRKRRRELKLRMKR